MQRHTYEQYIFCHQGALSSLDSTDALLSFHIHFVCKVKKIKRTELSNLNHLIVFNIKTSIISCHCLKVPCFETFETLQKLKGMYCNCLLVIWTLILINDKRNMFYNYRNFRKRQNDHFIVKFMTFEKFSLFFSNQKNLYCSSHLQLS